MIKLSDVKVGAQYRTRVRYRLVVLEYAGERGAAAAGRHYGISARRIRRWRKRWRRGGIEGLMPTILGTGPGECRPRLSS
jgi:transposase